MDKNPYQSPEHASGARPPLRPQWQVFAPRLPRESVLLERPAGVTLICLALVATIAFQFVFLFVVSINELILGLKVLGIPAGPYLMIVLAEWVFALVAAAGMWGGSRWGWWCGAYSCGIGFWHSFFGLAEMILLARNRLFAESIQSTIYFVIFTVRIPILLLILAYFFSPKFLAYVHLPLKRRGGTAAMLLLLAAVQELAECGVLYALRGTQL